jgi:hypothetical protein
VGTRNPGPGKFFRSADERLEVIVRFSDRMAEESHTGCVAGDTPSSLSDAGLGDCLERCVADSTKNRRIGRCASTQAYAHFCFSPKIAGLAPSPLLSDMVQMVTHRRRILVPNQSLYAHSGQWSLTAEGRFLTLHC